MKEYHGIDYGLGTTNIDRESGIRYGVIPMNDLSEWAHESFEDDYGNPSCPKCGDDVDEYDDEAHGEYDQTKYGCDDYACETCERTYDSSECFGDEPIGSNLDADGYLAERHSDGDIFILRSPYFTYAQFCSPCAPGACYLSNPVDESGPKAYCFAADWFGKDRPCPYPIFSVATGESVYRPES